MSIIIFLLIYVQSSPPIIVVESFTDLLTTAVSFSAAPDGGFYFIDQTDHTLLHVSNKNVIGKSVGGLGWGNQQFDTPSDVSSSFLFDIYVTDYNNKRIQKFDKYLNFIQTLDEKTVMNHAGGFQPRACAVSSLGELFIVEMDGRRIVKLSSRGKYLAEFGAHTTVSAGVLRQPVDIAVSSSNEVFVLDHNRLLVYDTFGNYLRRIVLSDSSIWQSVTFSDQFIVITSPRLINIISSDNTVRTSITQSNIINFPSDIEFVDAAIVRGKLTILTKKTVYRCSLRW